MAYKIKICLFFKSLIKNLPLTCRVHVLIMLNTSCDIIICRYFGKFSFLLTLYVCDLADLFLNNYSVFISVITSSISHKIKRFYLGYRYSTYTHATSVKLEQAKSNNYITSFKDQCECVCIMPR